MNIRIKKRGCFHTSTVFLINGVFITYVSYTSSQTTISVPLYTTIILCSCVFLMAEVTTSLSALNDNCYCP